MTSTNLTKLLQFIKEAIKHSRPAYKDYLGEETITKTTLIAEGTLIDYTENQSILTIKDSSFTGFVKGESYDVTIGEDTYQIIPQVAEDIVCLSNADLINDIVSKIEAGEEPPEFWLIAYQSPDGENNYIISMSHGSFVGKTISVSQIKTTVEKKYDIKKLSEELLPDTVAKKAEVTKAAKRANEAYVMAERAESEALDAQTTANAAQTTANAAQTTANNTISFVSQTLTDAQKAIARENIGAGTDNYNDLKNRPIAFDTTFVHEFDLSSELYSYNSWFYTSGHNAFNFDIDAKYTFVKSFPSEEPIKTMKVTLVSGNVTELFYIGQGSALKNLSLDLVKSKLVISSNIVSIEYPKTILDSSNRCYALFFTNFTNDTNWIFMSMYKTKIDLCKVKLFKKIDKGFLPSPSVDNTTIKLNDQGQLTLALSNANGVSF